jgi:hypothetical protein
MMRLVPVPWSRRVWALPFLTTLCRPAKPGGRRRHKTRVDGVRQMMKQVRRWLPEHRLVLVVDGGFAAVALALACVKNRVAMVSRLRWDAALDSPSKTAVPGHTRAQTHQGEAPTPLAGLGRARRVPLGRPWKSTGTGASANTSGSSRAPRCGTTPRLPPVAIRDVLVADPEGKLRMEAFFCTDLAATPGEILPWVVMRWSLEVTCEEGRAHLGLETQRQWSDQAIARTTPVLLALFSRVTWLALQLSPGGEIPVPVTAWYHKTAPTFVACLALVRRHLWRVRYLVHSAPEADIMQFPQEVLDRLIHGLPAAA